MGGSAFENCNRLNRKQYDEVSRRIGILLSIFGSKIRWGSPPELANKESFGDVDVHVCIVDKNLLTEMQFFEMLVKEFKPVETLRQGRMINLLSVERFQIDFVFFQEEKFEFSLAYNGNGDFAMLMNAYLSKNDLMLTVDGLILRGKNIKVVDFMDSFLLSTDFQAICSFLLIPIHSLNGLNSLSIESAFEILSNSRFFSPFAVDFVTKIEKMKKPRPMTQAFIDFLKTLDPTVPTLTTSYFENKAFCLEYFNKKDEFQIKRDSAIYGIEETNSKIQVKQILNGDHVHKWFPKLNGPEIGRVLKLIRQAHGSSWGSFLAWLSATEIETVHVEISRLI